MVQLGSGEAVSLGGSSLFFTMLAAGSGLLRPAVRLGGVGGQSISAATPKFFHEPTAIEAKIKVVAVEVHQTNVWFANH